VLSVDLLARAMARLPPGHADELTAGLRTLVDLAPGSREGPDPGGGGPVPGGVTGRAGSQPTRRVTRPPR
jgi:hypothetical protein